MIGCFGLNDRVILKKKHACGANEWRIIRTGCDIKIKCLKCSRIVMLDRQEFIKSAKKIIVEEQKEE